MARCIGIVVFGAVAVTVAAPQEEGTETLPYSAVEVSLGGVAQTARFHVLDFGDIPEARSEKAILSIRNLTRQAIGLEIHAFGSCVTARWEAARNPLGTSITADAGTAVGMEVTLSCLDTRTTLQMITLMSDSFPITHILAAYAAHPPILRVAKPLSKIPGTVSSGATPPGYHYRADHLNAAATDRAGNKRTCSSGLECRKLPSENGQVTWQIGMEGNDPAVAATGGLTVEYELNPAPPPVLKRFE